MAATLLGLSLVTGSAFAHMHRHLFEGTLGPGAKSWGPAVAPDSVGMSAAGVEALRTGYVRGFA